MDLHHLRVQRQFEVEQRPELAEEAARLKQIELNAIQRADLTLLVSEYEVDYLREEIGAFSSLVIPLIYEDFDRQTGFNDRADIAFVGGFRHPPNVDAVKHLVNDIWPRFRKFNTGAKLHIIGSHMPTDFRELAADDVLVVGFVPDLESYMAKMRMSVAPLRYGAGVKGKVGNSLRMGIPVVGTPIALEGMSLQHEQHVLTADTPDEFAHSMLRLYTDADLWETLSREGQGRVLSQFGLHAARLRLGTMCHNLIPRARRGAPARISR